MDEKYNEAIDLYMAGKYDEAIAAMAQSKTVDAEVYKQFVQQCRNLNSQELKITSKSCDKHQHDPEIIQETNHEERPISKNSRKKLYMICGVSVMLIVVIIIAISLNFNSYDESTSNKNVTISTLLNDLRYAYSESEIADIFRRLDSKDLLYNQIDNDVWDTWGSNQPFRISTHNRVTFDKLCGILKSPEYNAILQNDSISVYAHESSSNRLIIVWKKEIDGMYSIDMISEDKWMFTNTLQNKAHSRELDYLAKNLTYEEIMYGKKRGDIKLIILPKDEYGKKRHLYSISATDTVPRPFYPPNGKNWEIVDYFWGERVSKIIFRNPDADKFQQMEFWDYDCVDDEWDNKLESPCLSIVRDYGESVPRLKFTWKTANGKKVSLIDYTYQSEYKMPLQ